MNDISTILHQYGIYQKKDPPNASNAKRRIFVLQLYSLKSKYKAGSCKCRSIGFLFESIPHSKSDFIKKQHTYAWHKCSSPRWTVITDTYCAKIGIRYLHILAIIDFTIAQSGSCKKINLIIYFIDTNKIFFVIGLYVPSIAK